MKKKLFIFTFCLFSAWSFAQKVTIDPVISPSLFRYNDQITVTYNVTGTSLSSLNTAYIWVWIPGKNTNAKYNVNPATATADPAKFVKNTSGGTTTFSITFKPSDFFTGSISAETKLGMLIKGTDWANGQSTDFIADFWDGSFQIRLTSPTQRPLFVDTNDEIVINAETPVAADYSLFINTILVDEQVGVTEYSYTHTVTETAHSSVVQLIASTDANSSQASFQYIISVNSPTAPRPEGIISGINYDPVDNTKVTFCLLAPGKSSVYMYGEFTGWSVFPEYIMNRDGEFFWLELSGVTPGQEYAYQYLVDETLFLADPYADKILDPDDEGIPASVYPNLKPFPQQMLKADWYFNRASVFQTGQTPYAWQVTDFQKPEKEKLVVYELLIRDFFDSDHRSYQSLIDTIGYFKKLGVNAIELMPIMEFNGNESWGYNPAFMFAPDKYYGPKNKLKEFVDVCHQNGIAVILDIAMNHQDMPNSYVMMDFNFATSKPAATNKWFNTDAKHPFNVFFDMNHESSYTKDYLDTINYYWLNEYKVDGFRFDLSKGFTQVNNPSDVGAWSAYDATRIALLKRMADKIWEHTPDAYVILEHLSVNSEEKELAEYRSDEGKGMMLWGNLNHAYSQNSMGLVAESDISGVYYASRGWDVPHLVAYMESHDEERMMYRNVNFGKTTPSYDVKNINTALERVRAASTIFYTVPGPKMLWQFGEMGYDYSINHCPNGSNSPDCRVSPKPVKWEYREDPARKQLREHIRDLIRLRNSHDVFTNGMATITASGLVKYIVLKNDPYTATPAQASEMNAVVVANLDVIPQNVTPDFPHAGSWYDYYRGSQETVITTGFSVELKAGEYKLFTDFPIESSFVTDVEEFSTESVQVYPNPAGEMLIIKSSNEPVTGVSAYTPEGRKEALKQLGDQTWDVSKVKRGLVIVEVRTLKKVRRFKVIKN